MHPFNSLNSRRQFYSNPEMMRKEIFSNDQWKVKDTEDGKHVYLGKNSLRDSKNLGQNTYRQPEFCYNCRQPGHKMRQCPHLNHQNGVQNLGRGKGLIYGDQGDKVHGRFLKLKARNATASQDLATGVKQNLQRAKCLVALYGRSEDQYPKKVESRWDGSRRMVDQLNQQSTEIASENPLSKSNRLLRNRASEAAERLKIESCGPIKKRHITEKPCHASNEEVVNEGGKFIESHSNDKMALPDVSTKEIRKMGTTESLVSISGKKPKEEDSELGILSTTLPSARRISELDKAADSSVIAECKPVGNSYTHGASNWKCAPDQPSVSGSKRLTSDEVLVASLKTKRKVDAGEEHSRRMGDQLNEQSLKMAKEGALCKSEASLQSSASETPVVLGEVKLFNSTKNFRFTDKPFQASNEEVLNVSEVGKCVETRPNHETTPTDISTQGMRKIGAIESLASMCKRKPPTVDSDIGISGKTLSEGKVNRLDKATDSSDIANCKAIDCSYKYDASNRKRPPDMLGDCEDKRLPPNEARVASSKRQSGSEGSSSKGVEGKEEYSKRNGDQLDKQSANIASECPLHKPETYSRSSVAETPKSPLDVKLFDPVKKCQKPLKGSKQEVVNVQNIVKCLKTHSDDKMELVDISPQAIKKMGSIESSASILGVELRKVGTTLEIPGMISPSEMEHNRLDKTGGSSTSFDFKANDNSYSNEFDASVQKNQLVKPSVSGSKRLASDETHVAYSKRQRVDNKSSKELVSSEDRTPAVEADSDELLGSRFFNSVSVNLDGAELETALLQNQFSNECALKVQNPSANKKLAKKKRPKNIKSIVKKIKKRMAKLVKRNQEEIEEFNRMWAEKTVELEEEYKLEKAFIRSVLGSSPSLMTERLMRCGKEFGRKMDEQSLQKDLRFKDLCARQLKTQRRKKTRWLSKVSSFACEGVVCSESPLHGSQTTSKLNNSKVNEHETQIVPENDSLLSRELEQQEHNAELVENAHLSMGGSVNDIPETLPKGTVDSDIVLDSAYAPVATNVGIVGVKPLTSEKESTASEVGCSSGADAEQCVQATPQLLDQQLICAQIEELSEKRCVNVPFDKLDAESVDIPAVNRNEENDAINNPTDPVMQDCEENLKKGSSCSSCIDADVEHTVQMSPQCDKQLPCVETEELSERQCENVPDFAVVHVDFATPAVKMSKDLVSENISDNGPTDTDMPIASQTQQIESGCSSRTNTNLSSAGSQEELASVQPVVSVPSSNSLSKKMEVESECPQPLACRMTDGEDVQVTVSSLALPCQSVDDGCSEQPRSEVQSVDPDPPAAQNLMNLPRQPVDYGHSDQSRCENHLVEPLAEPRLPFSCDPPVAQNQTSLHPFNGLVLEPPLDEQQIVLNNSSAPSQQAGDPVDLSNHTTVQSGEDLEMHPLWESLPDVCLADEVLDRANTTLHYSSQNAGMPSQEDDISAVISDHVLLQRVPSLSNIRGSENHNQMASLSSSRRSNLPDPLQRELERLREEKERGKKSFEDMKLRLQSEYEKEIAEAFAQIKSKYEAKHKESTAAFLLERNELDKNLRMVETSKLLADAFRFKSSASPPDSLRAQQVLPSSSMHQLFQLQQEQRTLSNVNSSSVRPQMTSQEVNYSLPTLSSIQATPRNNPISSFSNPHLSRELCSPVSNIQHLRPPQYVVPSQHVQSRMPLPVTSVSLSNPSSWPQVQPSRNHPSLSGQHVPTSMPTNFRLMPQLPPSSTATSALQLSTLRNRSGQLSGLALSASQAPSRPFTPQTQPVPQQAQPFLPQLPLWTSHSGLNGVFQQPETAGVTLPTPNNFNLHGLVSNLDVVTSGRSNILPPVHNWSSVSRSPDVSAFGTQRAAFVNSSSPPH